MDVHILISMTYAVVNIVQVISMTHPVVNIVQVIGALVRSRLCFLYFVDVPVCIWHRNMFLVRASIGFSTASTAVLHFAEYRAIVIRKTRDRFNIL